MGVFGDATGKRGGKRILHFKFVPLVLDRHVLSVLAPRKVRVQVAQSYVYVCTKTVDAVHGQVAAKVPCVLP